MAWQLECRQHGTAEHVEVNTYAETGHSGESVVPAWPSGPRDRQQHSLHRLPTSIQNLACASLGLLCAQLTILFGADILHGCQVVVVLGGIQGARQVKAWVKAAQKQQQLLCQEVNDSKPKGKASAKIAVNKLFFQRLLTILSM